MWKNKFLVTLCLIFLLGAVFVPLGLAQLGAESLTQAFAGLAPLLSVIPMVQGLLKKGQNLYGEVKTGLADFKGELEQGIQRRLDADETFRTLNRKVQALEKEIEAQYEAMPTNVYASVAEFVSERLKSGGYEEHLGLMHQVKEDLAMLSQRLMPPPARSKEYAAKLRQLQEVFPRGPARVVLYIDDLDRCPPDTVVEVLEAVQLLVKNPLFIAILAIDERYINRALAQHYKGVLSRQGRPSASDYLEKIIQIPYRVRPLGEPALRSYLQAQVVVQDSETSGTKFNEFSPREFDLLVDCCWEVDLSPRSLKRLTNVYKLYKVLSRTRGENPTPQQQKAILTLLAFSGRYPDLMRDIQQDIASRYEEGRPSRETLGEVFNAYFLKCQTDRRYQGTYLEEELDKLYSDVQKLMTTDIPLSHIQRLFDFVRTFSFVGDIGDDADQDKLASVAHGVIGLGNAGG